MLGRDGWNCGLETPGLRRGLSVGTPGRKNGPVGGLARNCGLKAGGCVSGLRCGVSGLGRTPGKGRGGGSISAGGTSGLCSVCGCFRGGLRIGGKIPGLCGVGLCKIKCGGSFVLGLCG